jgi:dUTP pyrophosphatase
MSSSSSFSSNETDGKLCVVRLSSRATIPTKGSSLAAGFDLYSTSNQTVPAGGKKAISTDLLISVPFGSYGRIAPRSGLAFYDHIQVGAGVIDADFRGTVYVLLFNHGTEDFDVREGDRIAQLICEKICYPQLVEHVGFLPSTSRGENGFGSTGMK